MRLAVRATPRGGRDAIDGWTRDEAGRPVLKVRVSAAASEGAANAAVLALLAKSLGIPKSRLSLARGDTSRLKQIEAEGVTPEDLARAFGAPPG
ncbi:DUF167 family protein [Phenylobacterium deserti]|uniref:UPF0235 protein DJ018_04150 n=1 Tax=Phenylobacterium deserti TaxID=1914756 RepID=A0A328AS58_9CAUL|nr:DUF167 family protein [Phenylobacterium deserti]RAK57155.1 DUF167 domain-containing protein [Phenylobacterium deserti]